MHNGIFRLARQKYESAYAKIQSPEITKLKCRVCDWQAQSPTELEILSALTTVSLELEDYESVHRWAEVITDHEPCFLYDFTDNDGFHRYRVEYLREAYHTACYCKAVAFSKIGRTRAAIRYFTDAMVCADGRDEATYWQLEFLKQVQDARDAERKAKEEDLKQKRERLAKAEAKKLRRKTAKEAKRKAKMARGLGYIIGVGSD